MAACTESESITAFASIASGLVCWDLDPRLNEEGTKSMGWRGWTLRQRWFCGAWGIDWRGGDRL